jgi:hypothetical protein
MPVIKYEQKRVYNFPYVVVIIFYQNGTNEYYDLPFPMLGYKSAGEAFFVQWLRFQRRMACVHRRSKNVLRNANCIYFENRMRNH